jgi:VIT1/CCC1 family predicted Fe2+/Mn2+ transporter
MSNMTVNQRNQTDRATYAGTAERIRRGSERGVQVYMALAAAVAVVLCIASVAFLDDVWQWVVLGAIVVTLIGFMIAISPNRRA